MTFPTTSPKLLGYSTQQVDVIYARAQRQLLDPNLRVLTSEMLGAVKFDLVKGGYQIPAVDEELARLADQFDERDIQKKIAREGHSAISKELEEIIALIKPVLESARKPSFSRTRGGYKPGNVKRLLKRIEIRRSTLSAPASFELRTLPLGHARGGYSRSEVDEFISLVIAAQLRQNALG